MRILTRSANWAQVQADETDTGIEELVIVFEISLPDMVIEDFELSKDPADVIGGYVSPGLILALGGEAVKLLAQEA